MVKPIKLNRPFKFNDNGTIREIKATSWLKAFKEVMNEYPHLGPIGVTVVNLTEVKS